MAPTVGYATAAFQAEKHVALHLNCVVAKELMDGINDRACEHGWWDEIAADKVRTISFRCAIVAITKARIKSSP